MKNANLKSEEEMLEMLMTGTHLFDDEGNEHYYDNKHAFNGRSPF